MIRNLKVLIAAGMALAAFGVMGASASQAAEFHCNTKPCTATLKPDGTGKTAHHVFIVKKGAVSGSFTCNEISGEATLETETATTVEFNKNLKYSGCSIAGSTVEVHMNGCSYSFTSHGAVTVICPPGKQIELTIGIPRRCTVDIPAQGPLNGITYHNLGENTELTVSTLVQGISGTATDNEVEGCLKTVGFSGSFTEAEYTTGNTIVTGETDPGGVHKNVWWA